MASLDQSVRLNSFQHKATLHVTVTRVFRARVMIGLALIRLAAWVMRCNVEVQG